MNMCSVLCLKLMVPFLLFVGHTQQEQKRQDMYEEFLKEKLMIDEIVRRIYEEDQR